MYDELQLDTLGDKKTVLFLIMSDTDSTFNFLISMVYTQLFNLLCDKADDVYGGKLPILYNPGTRLGLMQELRLMQCYLMPDETALRELSEQVIEKLKLMTDAEFAELEFPLD